MKNAHPTIVASASNLTIPESPDGNCEPVIRLKLDKPAHWDWQLTTTADDLPVIQLLDRDGKLLVETSGRTAQRVRGSFRDGLKSWEHFPKENSITSSSTTHSPSPVIQGGRIFDGFSTKFGGDFFGYRATKSRSDVALGSNERGDKRGKKRHSAQIETGSLRRSESTPKRYSAGDFLRQQILDDLRTDNIEKNPEELAKSQCKRVRAFLRDQNEVERNPKEYSEENSRHILEDGSKTKREVKPEDLARIRAFLREKLSKKMSQEGIPVRNDSANDVSLDGIKKRLSDYVREVPRGSYRPRKVRSESNVVGFQPESWEGRTRTAITSMKLSSSESSRQDHPRRSRSREADSGRGRMYRKSRSDVISCIDQDSVHIDKTQTSRSRDRSSSERRKMYRKTKSDLLLGQNENSESVNGFQNPPRKIKSQDNVSRSWREYKEKKKQEKLKKDEEIEEEDFMSKPRWKDLQKDCPNRNCRICQNRLDCQDPLAVPEDNPTPPASRPGTSLQENYLFVDPEPLQNLKFHQTPIVARVQTCHRVDPKLLAHLSSPDFGYNSIRKSTFDNYKELYSRSNVKKSDTFKIVDGSEDVLPDETMPNDDDNDELEFVEGSLKNKSNEDIAKDYFQRVYELLKNRQIEAKRIAEGQVPLGNDDSSSSNNLEEVQRKRYRRRKKERSPGEEVVAVSPGGQNGCWRAQPVETTLINRRSCRSQQQQQQQPQILGRRAKPAPPPALISCKVNAKDISKYFDRPNKENDPDNNAPDRARDDVNEDEEPDEMGSNLSRHNGKGLGGRRTQSSGNLCDPKGKLNSVGKILAPCSSNQRESRYKFCGSLPNHLDDKNALDDEERENNNVTPDTIGGNLGGTLPHKKRSLGVHFADSGPTGSLDLVKHRSQDSLDENDPWRYQQSDLDLVRCRHGNIDPVRIRSADAIQDQNNRRFARNAAMMADRWYVRSSDLDKVGTLPRRASEKERQNGRGQDNATATPSSSSSSHPGALNALNALDAIDAFAAKPRDTVDGHKPDCELVKHRRASKRNEDENEANGDEKSSSTAAPGTGEPLDQGYASERSPEDEHPPSLPGQPFPNITPESTFRVTLQKSSRGLGLSVSGGGTAGPVRVKRLFPQQPAALSNKLQPGDILLAANGIPLTGLTNYEALEVLRTTPNTVELVVCRLPGDTSSNVTPPGAPPPPPARREPPSSLRILNPLPPLQIEPCGEFDIEMTKVDGSLGFTLRKADCSALGHYVRALVREPALSDGRIRPGDKIVAVDGALLSPMSHEEAVALLRQCGPRVKLRLYRDLAQTPVSALSPTEPDHPLRPPRTSLRQEAVDMLCDLAVRKLSPGASSGSSCRQSSGTSCNSPRRLRRLATRTPNEDEQEIGDKRTLGHTETTSDSDQCSIRTQIAAGTQTNLPVGDVIDPPLYYDESDGTPMRRPSFLDLAGPHEKPRFRFSIEGDETDDDYCCQSSSTRDVSYDGAVRDNGELPSEPASMPPMLTTNGPCDGQTFRYKNPAYQSANPSCGICIEAAAKSKVTRSSDQDIPGKVLGVEDPAGSKGLLKWKGVMFAPNEEAGQGGARGVDAADSSGPIGYDEHGNEVFMVELTRGWNSRLGFSLQPEGNRTVISVVHPDSVAAKDGRLKQGDIVTMVNDESVENMPTAEIIDLLRKIRGSIGITVIRRNKRDNPT